MPRWREVVALLLIGAAATLLKVYGPFDEPRATADPRPEPRNLTLLAAPLYGPSVLPTELSPVIDVLEEALNLRIESRRSETAATTLDALLDGGADLALLPALGCVQALEEVPATQLIAIQSVDEHTTTANMIVVRRQDQLEELDQLRGRRLCVADLEDTGPLLVRSWLRAHGTAPQGFFSRIHPTGGQLTALDELTAGRCDAAVVDEVALNARSDRLDDVLELFARVGQAPLTCWAATSSLDAGLARALTRTLTSLEPRLDLDRDRVGEVLQLTGFRPAHSSSLRAVKVAARFQGRLGRRGDHH